nr:ABC transporter transmembrane domain-containing protein [Caldalkalibacillus mannanilyticus]
MKPYVGLFIVGVIASVTVASLQILFAYLSEQALQQLDAGSDIQGILQIAGLIALCIPLGVIGKFFMEYAPTRVSAFAMKDIRNHLVSHIGQLPISFLEKQHSGDLISKISNDLRIIENYLKEQYIQWFYQPVIFFGAFAYLFTINWKLVIASLVFFPVAMLFIILLAKP